MPILAKTKPDSLTEKRALLASVRERIKWLQEEVKQHGNAGRMDRDRLIQAFHAGEVEGLWPAGRGRGQILLKTTSVSAWIDAQIASQTAASEAALARGKRRNS